MKKLFYFFISLFLAFGLFSVSYAEESQNTGEKYVQNEQIFKAVVIEVLEDRAVDRENGSVSIQQKLKLRGLDGDFKDREIIFDGTEFDVLSSPRYKLGDKVLVNYAKDIEGNENFYVIDYVRTNGLLALAIIFVIAIVAVGRLKGLRSLAVLALTFLIILKFIVPQIMNGANPIFISIIGSVLILVLAIYITEGFSHESTLAIVSITLALIFTGILSILFTDFIKLTGFASEDAMFLSGIANININIKGLLLAGIIIGALGVIDDIVISQISVTRELKIANPSLSRKEIFKKTMKIGVSHMSSLTNTLFLAYAGASLPLLILFYADQTNSLTFSQIINNETIATEITRTLIGSIGIITAIPLSTFLASYYLKREK